MQRQNVDINNKRNDTRQVHKQETTKRYIPDITKELLL